MERLPELGVLPHAIAVAADRHEVAVVDEAIDERGGHDVIAKDVAPLLEALVGRQHRRRVLVAPRHELKEEHRAGAADGEIDTHAMFCRNIRFTWTGTTSSTWPSQPPECYSPQFVGEFIMTNFKTSGPLEICWQVFEGSSTRV